MAKGNYFKDNSDMEWHLNNRCDFDRIYDLVPKETRDALGVKNAEEYKSTWIEILNTVGEYAGTQLENNAKKVSEQDLKLVNGEVIFPEAISENINLFKEIGGPPLSISHNYGGLSAPLLIELAASEMITRGCPSTLLNIVWYGSIALIIEKFGNEQQKQEYVTKIADGEYSGSMALTEPNTGSDLANSTTYGTEQPDGTWKISGSKQFISNGCGEITLVLAKNAKGAEGLKSLNIFIVPRKINDEHNFNIVKLEEKPGLHGSATCALEFNNSTGYLLGKNGEGFIYMLHLMNEARVAVAFQGLGCMEASWRLAKKFAEQRYSFGKSIDKHEIIAEKLLDMEVEIKALRSINIQAAYYATLIELGEKQLKNPELETKRQQQIAKKVAYYNKRLREWTPLIKWWGGEKSYLAARDSLMIHGGYGYTTEYKPEYWVRESLIVAIYEGTSHIQALMAMKDTLKNVVRDPKGFIEIALGLRLKGISESNPLKRKVYRMRQMLNSGIRSVLFQLLKENTRTQYNANKEGDLVNLIKTLSKDILKFENISPALLHAERICEMKAIVSMARCLLWDAEKDKSRTWIAERFINKQTPTIIKLQAEIDMNDPIINQRLKD